MASAGDDDYGPHSPDYGLSYEPDPFAEPGPIDDPDAWELDFREEDPNEDHTEAIWEQGYRDGHITREQLSMRRAPEGTPYAVDGPDQSPVIRSAIAKLQHKLATAELTDEERALEERTLAILQKGMDKKDPPAGPSLAL